MDLATKFKMTSSRQTVRIPSPKMDSPYPIEWAEKIHTRYGETVLLTLKEYPQAFVKVFLPKRYEEHFTEDDIKSVSERTVILALRYRGTCYTSKSYILEIE
jgi:hypothetical protein